MNKIKVLHNQTLFDIAIQYFGTVDAAFEMALLNNISVTDVLPVSLELMLPDNDYGFNEVVNYYKSNRIAPATQSEQPTGANELEYVFPQVLPFII